MPASPRSKNRNFETGSTGGGIRARTRKRVISNRPTVSYFLFLIHAKKHRYTMNPYDTIDPRLHCAQNYFPRTSRQENTTSYHHRIFYRLPVQVPKTLRQDPACPIAPTTTLYIEHSTYMYDPKILSHQVPYPITTRTPTSFFPIRVSQKKIDQEFSPYDGEQWIMAIGILCIEKNNHYNYELYIIIIIMQ